MSIEMVNESGYAGVNEEELIDVASFVLGEMDINPDAEVTISIVDLDLGHQRRLTGRTGRSARSPRACSSS